MALVCVIRLAQNKLRQHLALVCMSVCISVFLFVLRFWGGREGTCFHSFRVVAAYFFVSCSVQNCMHNCMHNGFYGSSVRTRPPARSCVRSGLWLYIHWLLMSALKPIFGVWLVSFIFFSHSVCSGPASLIACLPVPFACIYIFSCFFLVGGSAKHIQNVSEDARKSCLIPCLSLLSIASLRPLFGLSD